MNLNSLFFRRHGFLVSLHLDTMPLAGFFDSPQPLGRGFFPKQSLRFGFTAEEFKVPLGFFRLTAAGEHYSESRGQDGGQNDLSHVVSPIVDGCKRDFPFIAMTGSPKRRTFL